MIYARAVAVRVAVILRVANWLNRKIASTL